VTALVPISLYGWVVVVTALFTFLPPRRAVIAAFIGGWLFLPQAGIPIPGFPDLDKISATAMGAVLGVVLFDGRRLAHFRFSWVDIPMVVWCVCNVPSAVTNELGWWEGCSGALRDVFTWGIPYFIGRLYFSDLSALRELAIGFFLGGIVYVPFVAYELKMSPHLHEMVYGFHPSNFLMTIRFGGYRPMVFMQHGLMLAMWMVSATLIGVWLWHTGAVRVLFNIPIWAWVAVQTVITVMCKSTGALFLLALGLGALFINKSARSTALLVFVMSLTPVYMLVRAQGWWDGKQLIDVALMINQERADSIAGRLENEDILIAKASEKPVWGWGGWGRWRVYDSRGNDITVSDGYWVIARGEKGMVGLASLTAIALVPFVLLLRRVPARDWANPAVAGASSLAMLLMLYSIDNLFNAMLNPIYMLAAGGLSSLYVMNPSFLPAMPRLPVDRLPLGPPPARPRPRPAQPMAQGGRIHQAHG